MPRAPGGRPLDDDPLSFRRQYAIAPGDLELPASWTRLEVGKLRILAHPDLDVTRATRDDRTLVLLGYLLDAAHPDRDDGAILESILDRHEDHVFEATRTLGGRWALLDAWPGHARILNDATGLRPVFRLADDARYLASSPNLLAELLGLEPDPAVRGGFLARDARTLTGWWWPGTATPFAEIERLVPNHVLDLATGRRERFWPGRPVVRRDLADVAAETAATLTGTMRAAANRFDLALGLTGGRDCRLLLALARDVRDRLLLYTAAHEDLRPGDPDLEVPARVARALDLPYRCVEYVAEADAALDAAHARLATIPRRVFPGMIRSLARGLEDRYVCVQAVVNEIARTKYPYRPGRVTARDLANLTRMGEHPFVVERIGRWLEDARYAADSTGHRLEDLFYLEQHLGSWHAMNRTEFDLAHECLEPFNARALLEAVLALPRGDRTSWPNPLYDELFESSWPEVLEVPLTEAPKSGAGRGPVGRLAARVARTLGWRSKRPG